MQLIHAVHEPAGSGPHPTIIALHGWGANALDLLGLAPHLAGGRFLVICPQGRIEVPLGPVSGYGWFPITMGGPLDAQAFANGVKDARDFIDAAMQRYPIDPKKLVVLGFSQGGVIAYALALTEPDRFSGLVALSSWLPAPIADQLVERDRSKLYALVHHGSEDEVINVSRGRESMERLRALRIPVTYREFAMGHQLNQHSLADISNWLQEKVLSPIVVAS